MQVSQPVARPPTAVSGGKKQLFADMESYSNHKFYVSGLTALSVKAPDLWVVAGGLKTVWTTQIDRAATCGNFIYLNGKWITCSEPISFIPRLSRNNYGTKVLCYFFHTNSPKLKKRGALPPLKDHHTR